MITRPRTQGKIRADIGRKEFTEFLFNNLSKDDRMALNGRPVKSLVAAVYRCNRLFMQNLCDTGDTKDLPYSAGMMYVSRNAPKIIRNLYGEHYCFTIDWKKTNDFRDKYPERIKSETGGKIFHTNLHTGNDILRFVWDKSSIRYNELRFFRFQPVRESQRYLAKIAKDPLRKVDYFRKDSTFFQDKMTCYRKWVQKHQ